MCIPSRAIVNFSETEGRIHRNRIYNVFTPRIYNGIDHTLEVLYFRTDAFKINMSTCHIGLIARCSGHRVNTMWPPMSPQLWVPIHSHAHYCYYMSISTRLNAAPHWVCMRNPRVAHETEASSHSLDWGSIKNKLHYVEPISRLT